MNVIVANKYETILKTLNIDVIKSVTGKFESGKIVSMFQNFFFQRMILDITSIENYKDIKNIQTLSISLDMDKVILLLDDSKEVNSPIFLSQLVSIGIYNFARNLEEVQYLLEHPNIYRDVAHYQELNSYKDTSIKFQNNIQYSGPKVIGIKNITKQSGATTLVYMLKKQLQKKFNVLALEINKRDFMYFNDKDMKSISENDLKNVLDNNLNKDVVLVDLNESSQANLLCNDVIYLIEPSIIKLHKMMFISSNILKDLKNKKVVLNQSLLNSDDVKDFESEANFKVFLNLPPLDERKNDFPILEQLISKLGL